MHDDLAPPLRPSLWSRVRAQFMGLPPHLAWLRTDLPAAERWILRLQGFLAAWTVLAGIWIIVIKSARLLGHEPPDAVTLPIGLLILAGAFGSGLAITAILGGLGVVRLVRGEVRTWRLATLTLVCAAILGGAVYFSVRLAILFDQG